MTNLDMNFFQAALLRGPKATLQHAQSLGGSDLHITPKPKHYEIQIRVAGTLHEAGQLSLAVGRELVQAFKAAGKMNIAETRKPQDARLEIDQIQSRLATHPCINGENLVIRLLSDHGQRNLAQAGFSANALSRIGRLLQPDQGLVLVAGATGSGKTTTLHAMLNALGKQAGRIATLEDPVEIVNTGAMQTDLSRLPHLDFAQGLRSLMRQDPDTLLVGEIRDFETAELTLHAALTGHRVFASVHAPDSAGALYRLTELGLGLPSLLNSLNGIVCQRLITLPDKHHRRPWAEIIDFTQGRRTDLLDRQSVAELIDSSPKHAFWTFADDLEELGHESNA